MPQQAGLKRTMVGNGERLPRRVGTMTQANMAAALAHHFIAEPLEGPDSLLS